MLSRKIVMFALGMGLLVMLASVSTVAAPGGNKVLDFNERFPINLMGVDNPCTGFDDDIELSGDLHAHGKIVANNNNLHFNFHLNGHLSGEDVDGLGYNGNTAAHFTLKVPNGPATVGANILLVSQGSTENMAINFTLHVSPNGNVTLNLADSVCRGATD